LCAERTARQARPTARETAHMAPAEPSARVATSGTDPARACPGFSGITGPRCRRVDRSYRLAAIDYPSAAGGRLDGACWPIHSLCFGSNDCRPEFNADQKNRDHRGSAVPDPGHCVLRRGTAHHRGAEGSGLPDQCVRARERRHGRRLAGHHVRCSRRGHRGHHAPVAEAHQRAAGTRNPQRIGVGITGPVTQRGSGCGHSWCCARRAVRADPADLAPCQGIQCVRSRSGRSGPPGRSRARFQSVSRTATCPSCRRPARGAGRHGRCAGRTPRSCARRPLVRTLPPSAR